MIRFAFRAGLTVVLAISTFALAEDPPTADIQPGDVAADPAMQEMVKQLDAKKKDDRDAAFAKLKEAGAAAIPALEAGAVNGKRDATNRAIEILQGHLKSADPAPQKAAIEALQRLAVSKTPLAVKRARDILQGANIGIGNNLGGARPGNGGFGFGFGGFGGGGDGTGEGKGNFGIQVSNPPGSKVKKYSMKGNGGERDIEVEEQARTIKIRLDPQGEIKIEITEMKDGKAAMRTIEAKDAPDLKQKDAEAFKDFEEYSKPPRGIQVGPIPGGFGGQFGPGLPGLEAIPQGPGGGDVASRKALETSVQELEKAIEMIRRNPQLPKELKPLQIETLQAQVRLVREQLRKLEQAERAQKGEKE